MNIVYVYSKNLNFKKLFNYLIFVNFKNKYLIYMFFNILFLVNIIFINKTFYKCQLDIL